MTPASYRFALLCFACIVTYVAEATPWREIDGASVKADNVKPTAFRAFELDAGALREVLGEYARSGVALSLALPLPEGGESTFLLDDSGTMPPAMRQRYPGIVSLAGSDGQGRRARVDVSELGFNARVFETGGGWIVAPLGKAAQSQYIVYRRDALPPRTGAFRCGVDAAHDLRPAELRSAAPAPKTITGPMRRNYRLAVAANAPYVAAVGGGTASGGLAAVVTSINRVNEVYETELSIHMTLVPNNDLVIYPDPATDPYANSDLAADQNTPNLDAAIGNANYDIAQVFTTGSGGVAYIATTCNNAIKGGAATGLLDPQGDHFDIDYLAHGLGHQFSAVHTFNGCNRPVDATSGYEPGGGSTIMALAGLCGADDLQPNSDPWFHAASLQDIHRWTLIFGGTCAQSTPNPNAAPVVNAASLPEGKTIPALTPFALTAVASDPDGDVVTYDWEQFDLGEITTLAQGDIGNGPVLRSFLPTKNPTRVFPRLSTLLGGPAAPGEILPTTTRTLHFRLTVRDGRADDGRSTSADVALDVTNAAGPFALTLPGATSAWGRGETRFVRWNVAHTDVAPVSCAAVDIALSTDGGTSFTLPLVSGTPNIGVATVVVPAVADTSTARVRVACATNVFFNVTAANFAIGAVGSPDPVFDAIFVDGFDPP